MFNPQSLKTFLEPFLKTRCVIAFSGGLDSHVLLHALSIAYADEKQKLLAVHINHGWHRDAELWAEHCGLVAKSLGINYQVISISAKKQKGESLEALARENRYVALRKLMQTDDLLLTAHQQDDQAETLLLQLFRGAGVKGLSAMPKIAEFSPGLHLRPLLDYSRAELKSYAEKNDLMWIEDSSNTDLKFDRNYIRHKIFPKIKAHWPEVAKTIARTATHCANTQVLLDQLAEVDFRNCIGSYFNTLSIAQLKNLTYLRWQNLFRTWLMKMGHPLPSNAQLEQVYQTVVLSAEDRMPKVTWTNIEIRRYQDDLYALRVMPEHDHEKIYQWNLTEELDIPGIGILKAQRVLGKGVRENVFANNIATVRFRQFAERCHPVGRQGSHPLKKLFQEWKVPPWERNKIPLIYRDDQLITVVGFCICESFAAKKDERGVVVNLLSI